MPETKRDAVERFLLDGFGQVKSYTPEYSSVIKNYKDGSFGVSNLSFALYSNGLNPRGRSSKYPYGLIFEDGETLFSIGYFRKEHDPEDSDGYLFVVAPRGKNVGEKIRELTEGIKGKIPCNGVYARFLKSDQYLELLNSGFLPIEEFPWHPEYPKEDETLSNSIVTIDNGSKKIRLSNNRFRNFLERRDFEYSLKPITSGNKKDGRHVIDSHFKMLEENKKAMGSTPEDHYNSLTSDLLNLESVRSYIGYLQESPVSIFVGEMLSPNRIGLYTPFTLRDTKKISCIVKKSKSFTAMPTYAYAQLFEKLKEEGIEEVHLGGSELPDLNRYKRKLGAEEDPSYWAVKSFTPRLSAPG